MTKIRGVEVSSVSVPSSEFNQLSQLRFDFRDAVNREVEKRMAHLPKGERYDKLKDRLEALKKKSVKRLYIGFALGIFATLGVASTFHTFL